MAVSGHWGVDLIHTLPHFDAVVWSLCGAVSTPAWRGGPCGHSCHGRQAHMPMGLLKAQCILGSTQLLPHIPLAAEGCDAATMEVAGCCFERGAIHTMHSTQSWLKPVRLWGNAGERSGEGERGEVSRAAPFFLKGLWVMSL